MAEDEIEIGDTVTRVARGAHWTVQSLDDLGGSTVYRLKSQLSGRHETVLVPRGSDRSAYLQLHTKASGTNLNVVRKEQDRG